MVLKVAEIAENIVEEFKSIGQTDKNISTTMAHTFMSPQNEL